MEGYGSELAVMLNDNAKRVTKRMKNSLQAIIPAARLYSAKTMEEAGRQVREALDSGYKSIVCGGGDGTIVHIINQVRAYMDEKNAMLQDVGQEVRQKLGDVQWPKIGILSLGTGNAFATTVGSKKPKDSLQRMSDTSNLSTRTFNLVEAENKVFHFSGFGYDAAVLNDFYTFKKRFDRGFLSPFFRTIGGYLTSMTLKTIPRMLMRRKQPQVQITNGGGDVYSVNRTQGIQLLTSRKGDVIYEGPVNVIGAATTPYYGFGLVAFPFAFAKPGYFNLRMISAKLPLILRNALSIYRGRYEGQGVQDFLASDLHLEFDQPMPYQVGGDSEGYRQSIDYKMADFSVDVFDLLTPRKQRTRTFNA